MWIYRTYYWLLRKSKIPNTQFTHFARMETGELKLCELEEKKLYQLLAENTLIIYIKTNKDAERVLIERSKNQPKPVYYHPDFFESALRAYLEKNSLEYVAQITPDDFVRWVFPKLIEDRLEKYQALADQYGYTIKSDDLYHCHSANDVINLISGSLD